MGRVRVQRRAGSVTGWVDGAAGFSVKQYFASTLSFNDFHPEWRLRRGSRADGIQQTSCGVFDWFFLLALLFRTAVHFGSGEQVVNRGFRRGGCFLVVRVAGN